MKSVEPGILPNSHCSTFQPSEFAKENLIYMSWCGHYYCTENYMIERDTYPEDLLLYELSISTAPPIEEDSPVNRVIQYVLHHVGENITLETLAGMTNFSTYYLSHLFKKQTGYTLSEYIINTRIEKAQRLLTHTGKPIAEIAYEVGYGSPNSFINIFTRKVGCSPTVYRKRQKNAACQSED